MRHLAQVAGGTSQAFGQSGEEWEGTWTENTVEFSCCKIYETLGPVYLADWQRGLLCMPGVVPNHTSTSWAWCSASRWPPGNCVAGQLCQYGALYWRGSLQRARRFWSLISAD